MTALCDSCGATIEWARFAKSGKPVPLDVGRYGDGNLEVRFDDHGALVVRVVPVAERDRPLARTHFATCPHAARHRRR